MSRYIFFALCFILLAVNFVTATEHKAIKPPVIEDLNDDPAIIEVILNATMHTYDFGTGNETEIWSYNGITPGPTIEAHVGQTLIVHFNNNLSDSTTIHWHGMELPATMDGSHLAQQPIKPGDSFRYEFTFLRPALFWYHPHVRTNVQVEKGLYGTILVSDTTASKNLGLPENEHILVLDDVQLNDAGQLTDPFPSDPVERAIAHVNGKEGNVLLVNGRSAFRDTIKNGEPHRLRILNASNSRFMRISIPGHKMWRIGGDGGLLESPIEISPVEMVMDTSAGGHHGGGDISDPDPSKGLLLTPAERADIVFTPIATDSIVIEWHDIARGRHSALLDSDGKIVLGHAHDDGKAMPQTLAVLYLDGDPAAASEYTPPSQLRSITPITYEGARRIPVMFGHGDPSPMGHVQFFAQMKNGMPLPFPMVTPDDAPKMEPGETIIWEVNNMTGGDHNFHTHGWHYQLIETEYVDMDNMDVHGKIVPAPYLEDKDTIIIPRRSGMKGRSRTITRLAQTYNDDGREGQIFASGKKPTADKSGGWLFHCHLLEHSAMGMMSFFQIVADINSVGVNSENVPSTVKLHANYPNPFNPSTNIGFEIAGKENVEIRIFDILGREVRTFVQKEYKAGVHSVVWNGKNNSGLSMSSGVYFYHLKAGSFSDVMKMTLVK